MSVAHPPFLDGTRGRWTWRGHGYALDTQLDVDWQGRPWTVQEPTIRALFGQWRSMTAPEKPKVNAKAKGQTR